jgi:hypothetical protein
MAQPLSPTEKTSFVKAGKFLPAFLVGLKMAASRKRKIIK